ncbi:hypothetical protein JCM11641_007319 [Rhodosporidiobolus odoratus]
MAFLRPSSLYPQFAGLSKPDLFCDKVQLDQAHPHDPTAVVGKGAPVGSEGVKGKEFDFVICGGGTAGCVLASRLTEDPSVSVLLIEAGESDQKQLFSKIPAGWGNLWKTPAEWNYSTVPQANLNGRELYQPRGKMLGGCSAINAQVYQHCSPEDYDHWEKLGADGWSWKDLQPYFARAEKYTPHPDHQIDETKRGKSGEWCTSYPPTNDLTKAFVDAGPECGLPKNADINVETNSSGITRFQATISSTGQRSSTSAAYLTPEVFNRKNLSILTGTTCTRLLLSSAAVDSQGKKRVEGVELALTPSSPSVKPNPERWVARARRDVIVAQGSFGTPHLLLASGIGRKETLDKAGVKQVVQVDGVGEGLKDHVLTTVAFRAKKGTSLEFLKSPVKTIPSLARWLTTGKGPLASNLAEAGAFLRSDTVDLDGSVSETANGVVAKGSTNSSGKTSADLEIINAPLYYVHHGLEAAPAGQTQDFFTLAPIVLKAFSSGTVTIKSGDVLKDGPLIDPKYYEDERDKKVILAGLHLARRLSQTSPLKEYLLEVAAPSMSLDEWAKAGDERLLQHVKEKSDTIYHPMSSCRIGPREKGGCADPSLLVYGTTNLKVCDASVFPDTVSGHPQAAVVAVAEKFAAMLKAQTA